MATYLNPGNRGFEKILQSEYVDKTGMITLINKTIGMCLADRVEKMMENADQPSDRIIRQKDYLKIFGL